MSELKKRFRLFPGLMIILVGALVLKVASISAGVQDILSENAAQAQEQSDDADKDAGDAGEGDASRDAQDTGNGQPAPATQAPELNNQEEIEILLQLRRRREELDARDNAIKLKEGILDSTEKRIDKKISELKSLEDTIKKLLDDFTAEEKRKLERLVSVYETMKPKEAAPIFDTLDMRYQIALAKEMNPKKFAAMMAKMTNKNAKALTEKMADIAQAPTLDDVEKARDRNAAGS